MTVPLQGAMHFPALLDATEKESADSQRSFYWSRGAEFVALATAALFGAIPRDGIGPAGPSVALGLFVAALVIRVSGAGDKAERRWYDARAAAESIKSASWQFAVGGEAYRLSDSEAASRFLDAQRAVIGTLKNLSVPADKAGGAIPEQMLALRNSPLDVRHREYMRLRVEDQRSWYQAKAARNGIRARQWRWLLIATEATACALGLARALDAFETDWLGVLAAAAAGVAAWKQTKNYASLAEIYSVTSHEITMVAALMTSYENEQAWSQAVHDAEAAFSREHTMWLARRQGPVPNN